MILVSSGCFFVEVGIFIFDIVKGFVVVDFVFEIFDCDIFIDFIVNFEELVERVEGYIDVCNVIFFYFFRLNVVVFQKFFFIVKVGRIMVMVGQSGSGKLMIIGFIERFYDLFEGVD